MGDDRPVRYTEERDDGEGGTEQVVVYRASGLGSCTRVFVAHANGRVPSPTPAWMQEIFDQGTAFEDAIRQHHAAKVGGEVTDDQFEVELDLGRIKGNHVVIRGHVDGKIHDEHGTRLFEAKKFRDSTWPKFLSQGIECNVNYPWQLSVYMHALDLDEADFVGGHVIEVMEGEESLSLGTVIDGWELTETECVRVVQPPFSVKAIRQRVALVEGLIADGLDAPEVACQRNQYPCPFYELHDWDTDEYELPTEGENGEVVKILLDGYHEASERLKAAEATAKELRDAKKRAADGLYAWIEAQGDVADVAKKFVGHGYTLTRTRSVVKEHVVKESTRDYLTVKADAATASGVTEKAATDAPAKKVAKKVAKKAPTKKKSTTTRKKASK